MNTKNFILGGIAGGIVNFLGGYVFYVLLFASYFPEGDNVDLLFIFLGSLSVGFLVSYIFAKWAAITTAMAGLSAGAVLGLLIGLMSNFFIKGMESAAHDYAQMALDTGIQVILTALVGATIAFMAGKMK